MQKKNDKILTYEEKVQKTLDFVKRILYLAREHKKGVKVEINVKGNSVHIDHYSANHTEL